jgi:hypothetical protein
MKHSHSLHNWGICFLQLAILNWVKGGFVYDKSESVIKSVYSLGGSCICTERWYIHEFSVRATPSWNSPKKKEMCDMRAKGRKTKVAIREKVFNASLEAVTWNSRRNVQHSSHRTGISTSTAWKIYIYEVFVPAQNAAESAVIGR